MSTRYSEITSSFALNLRITTLFSPYYVLIISFSQENKKVVFSGYRGNYLVIRPVCRLSSLEGVGPVDEVEVQILQLQVLQALQEGRLHVLRVMSGVPQLGCDEHVLSSQGLVHRQRQRQYRQ